MMGGSAFTFGFPRLPTQKLAEDELRRELARARQELDAWTTRANAARITLGAESPVTATCNQMVTFWASLHRTTIAALMNAERPISTLRLRPDEAG